MLRRIGIKNIDELFSDIPEHLRIDGLDMDGPRSELEIERRFEELMMGPSGNDRLISFLGGGTYDHFIPTLAESILNRSELYTSYTPYQPELSQGMLQAMFEYQSLISELLNMDVVNSSMYDWATSIGEAILLAYRNNRKKRFLVPALLSKDKKSVIENYLKGAGIELLEFPFSKTTGQCESEALFDMIKGEDVGGVYIENPNLLGMYEQAVLNIKENLRDRQVYIVGVNPMSLGITKPPGDYGADVVVGDAQPIGIPMSYGGPTTGIFAATSDLVRKMPGRIIGVTKDADGNRAFCMTLSTREQHIRRERATSNICTNEALTSLAVAVYLSTLGKNGLRAISHQNASRAKMLSRMIDGLEGFSSPAYGGFFFNEFPVRTDVNVLDLMKRAKDKGVIAGIPMKRESEELEDIFTLATTEMHTKADMERLVRVLKESREELK